MTVTPHDRPTTPQAAAPAGTRSRLVIDYWTVAMGGQDSCDSCDSTLVTVQDAVQELQPLAERLGITLQIRPRILSTWEEALNHRISASPTLRAAELELRPIHSGDSEERHWTWRGQTSTALQAEAVTDTLLQALAAHSAHLNAYLSGGGPSSYLTRFLTTPPVHHAPAPEPSGACVPGTGCG